jgi:hypothetical protein
MVLILSSVGMCSCAKRVAKACAAGKTLKDGKCCAKKVGTSCMASTGRQGIGLRAKDVQLVVFGFFFAGDAAALKLVLVAIWWLEPAL